MKAKIKIITQVMHNVLPIETDNALVFGSNDKEFEGVEIIELENNDQIYLKIMHDQSYDEFLYYESHRLIMVIDGEKYIPVNFRGRGVTFPDTSGNSGTGVHYTTFLVDKSRTQSK